MRKMAQQPLFKPFRALGYITDSVPFAVQRRGKETFVTVSVGKSWQVSVLQCVGPHQGFFCPHFAATDGPAASTTGLQLRQAYAGAGGPTGGGSHHMVHGAMHCTHTLLARMHCKLHCTHWA